MTHEETWLLKEKYRGEKTEEFFADCAKLRQGKPLAYLIGHIPFLNATISLDSHPLIPRPETEYWVEKAILEIQNNDAKPLRVLDLCAGSGCVGIAVLQAVPYTHVDFVEIDEAHHGTIQKNIVINGISQARARIFGGSLFEQVSGMYAYILSNPPYIDKTLNRVDLTVTNHEPSLALYGGTEGRELLDMIISRVSTFLSQNGVLYLEHEPEQVQAIHTNACTHGLLATTYTDQFNVARYTRITRARS